MRQTTDSPEAIDTYLICISVAVIINSSLSFMAGSFCKDKAVGRC